MRPSPGAFETASAVLPASVFAQRAGATRNLSLWPFGSKKPAADANAVPAESASPSLWDSPAKSGPSPVSPPAGAEPVVAAQAPAASPVPGAPDAVASSPAVSSGTVPDALDDAGFNGVLDMPEYVGYLKNDLGLDFGWGPTSMLQNLLEHLHITAGLEWWAAIASAAVLIRVALFWPTLVGAKYGARMQLLQKDPEFMAAQAGFKAATQAGDQGAMMRQRGIMQNRMRAAGTSFVRTLAPPFMLVPLSYGMFRGLRAMAALPVPSLENGGIAWFADLSVYDPTYILPLTSAAITVIAMKLQQKGTVGPQNAAMQKMILYVMTPFMFLCTMWLPAAVQWFFATFALASAVQGQLTLMPAIRRWAELPPLPDQPLLPSTSKSAKAVVDASWQAPKARGGLRGMMDDARKNATEVKSSLQSTMDSYGGGDAAAARKKAEAYELRRQREEEEKQLMRMEEHRRKKMLRGKNGA